jgi:glycosyltransferase involved in cell wall biosynthesis
LCKEKGVFDVLKIAKQIPHCSVVLQGPVTEADLELIKRESKDLDIFDRVKIFEPAKYIELSEQYAKASVFILLSQAEGFPNVILEAMAHGCPVVASDVGAIAEMLGCGTSMPAGYVVEVGDIKHASEKITLLLEDAKLYLEFSLAAKRRCAELYSENLFVDKIRHILNEVIHSDMYVDNTVINN